MAASFLARCWEIWNADSPPRTRWRPALPLKLNGEVELPTGRSSQLPSGPHRPQSEVIGLSDYYNTKMKMSKLLQLSFRVVLCQNVNTLIINMTQMQYRLSLNSNFYLKTDSDLLLVYVYLSWSGRQSCQHTIFTFWGNNPTVVWKKKKKYHHCCIKTTSGMLLNKIWYNISPLTSPGIFEMALRLSNKGCIGSYSFKFSSVTSLRRPSAEVWERKNPIMRS